MPKRKRMMHNDALHAPLAIGGGIIVYGYTLETIVLLLWAAYVLILIATKLPELVQKYLWLGRAWRRLRGKK